MSTVFILASNMEKTNASLVHSRTNAPSAEKINEVTRRSYEERIRIKRELLSALKLKKASQEQIKVVENEITALLSTVNNIKGKAAKTATMFSGKADILQGQHVRLARMPQYNAVGVLHTNEGFLCSATIVNETDDQKYWIGITAAHCIKSQKDSKNNPSLVSDLSFCFKPLSFLTVREKETDTCNEDDWISAVGAIAHADYFTDDGDNPARDMAFFLIPKTAKTINYPLFPTKEERQKLYAKINEQGLEVIGVGYGKAGNVTKELQAQFDKKRSKDGAIKFSDFIKLEEMGEGFRNGEVDHFKSAYLIPVYTKKSAQKLTGVSGFSSDLIEIPHPVTWGNGKFVSDDANIFSGSGRPGDSGRALFTKNSEGKNILISVASVGQGFITVVPRDYDDIHFFQEFGEIPQRILRQCDTGRATCSVYFAGADSSLLDPVMHTWAMEKVSLLKKMGPDSLAIFDNNDNSSISCLFSKFVQKTNSIQLSRPISIKTPIPSQKEINEQYDRQYVENHLLPLIRKIIGNNTIYQNYNAFMANRAKAGFKEGMSLGEYRQLVLTVHRQRIHGLGLSIAEYAPPV